MGSVTESKKITKTSRKIQFAENRLLKASQIRKYLDFKSFRLWTGSGCLRAQRVKTWSGWNEMLFGAAINSY